MIKRRLPLFSLLFSLVMPGLGHIYAGNIKKGFSLIIIQYSFIIIMGLFGILSTFYGIASIITFFLLFYSFVIISSIRLSINNKEYELKAYNRWYWYLIIFITVTIFANTLFYYRSNILGYETYRMTAKSMTPTLLIDDFVTVNTRYNEPKVGDVVVFLYPKDRKTPYVKRIAALGDDTITIKHGVVIRNGIPENILNNISKDKRQKYYSYSMKEIRVPKDHIFFLGDWRDNSRDSRFWGFVPLSDLIGKVTYIWLSKDIERIGNKVK